MKKTENNVVVFCDETDWNVCCGCIDFGNAKTDCIFKECNRTGIVPQAADDSKRLWDFIKTKILKIIPPRDVLKEMEEEQDKREFDRLSGRLIERMPDISEFHVKGTVRELQQLEGEMI